MAGEYIIIDAAVAEKLLDDTYADLGIYRLEPVKIETGEHAGSWMVIAAAATHPAFVALHADMAKGKATIDKTSAMELVAAKVEKGDPWEDRKLAAEAVREAKLEAITIGKVLSVEEIVAIREAKLEEIQDAKAEPMEEVPVGVEPEPLPGMSVEPVEAETGKGDRL